MDDSDFNRLMDDMSESDFSDSDSMLPTPNKSPTSQGSMEKAFMSKLAMSPPSFDEEGKVEMEEEAKGSGGDYDASYGEGGFSGPVKTPRYVKEPRATCLGYSDK